MRVTAIRIPANQAPGPTWGFWPRLHTWTGLESPQLVPW
ncbi:hypothetical protein CCH79_00020604 [Gambusia affinis]|uniref:Uncharacterized protein n=1 Tax=Gambusia affinis TaxID=33528 RepID=A0A315UUS1_GAMAF|nr:hypothetical protein CCH79_00020604 [Gambusia affinis]